MPASDHRACLNCGGPFTTTYGFRAGPPAKYCSAKCCNQFNLRKARERKKAEQPAPVPAAAPAPAPAARPHDNGRALAHERTADGTRRRVDPTTCERDYSSDEFEFLKAVERYRRECKRPFPTTSELLQIAVSLGYRKVAPAGPLPGAK